GREGFQFLLSRLLLSSDQGDKGNLRSHAIRTLRFMANVLSQDLTIQQCLYDTGYVDVAAFELYEWWCLVVNKDAQSQVTIEGRMAVAKLVAHYHYGTKDGEIDGRPVGRRLGLEMMEELGREARRISVMQRTASEADAALFAWYGDFFEDH